MWDGIDDEGHDSKEEIQFEEEQTRERRYKKLQGRVKQDVRARTIKNMYQQIMAPYTVGDAQGVVGEEIAREMDILYEIA